MLNERKLTKSELAKREDIVMKMKKNKRALVKQYGKDAESVMYGRATNQAKKQSEGMNQDKLREMLKDALQNPKAADLNKDGKLSDYEEKRGAAIEKNLDESSSSEERRIAKRAIRSIAKYRGVGEDEARNDLIRAAKELGGLKEAINDVKETIKLGKTLNEELCAKGKAYRKKRMAAGEKSSAYLSGRAVKVCKGQMKG